MKNSPILFAAAGAILVGGCSSRPRTFAPVLGAAPSNAAAFEANAQSCRAEVAARTNRRGEHIASAAGGLAAGAGTGLAVGAATSGTYATMGGAMAAMGATIIAAPVAAIGGAWAIAKMKRAKKERGIKAAFADCLARLGYPVATWRVMSKREVRAMAAAPALAPVGTGSSQVAEAAPRE